MTQEKYSGKDIVIAFATALFFNFSAVIFQKSSKVLRWSVGIESTLKEVHLFSVNIDSEFLYMIYTNTMQLIPKFGQYIIVYL